MADQIITWLLISTTPIAPESFHQRYHCHCGAFVTPLCGGNEVKQDLSSYFRKLLMATPLLILLQDPLNLSTRLPYQVHDDRKSLRNRSDRCRMAIDWHWFDWGGVAKYICKTLEPLFSERGSVFSWWGKELDLVTWFWHKLSSSVWGLEGDISNCWNAAAELRSAFCCGLSHVCSANVTLCAWVVCHFLSRVTTPILLSYSLATSAA